jgi:replication factor A1
LTNDELTPLFEEMKRVLKDKIDDETLRSELDKYLNEYHVDVDAAKRGILRKYGAIDSATAAGMSIVKKISALTGTEQNVDVIAKIASSERRSLKNKGLDKTVVSGTLGDETGTVQFTIWEPGSAEYPAGSVYAFRNCYCKVWNGNVQLNVGNRGRVEPVDANIEVSEKTVGVPSESKTISQLNGSEQNVDITAKVVAVEQRTINTRNGEKTVTSGTIGDETGTVPFTIWEPADVAKGGTYAFKNCYCKIWSGKPQVNIGNKGRVEPINAVIDVSELSFDMSGEESRIRDVHEGSGNVNVRGRIMSVEVRDVVIRGENRTVWSGIIADETGRIQYSAWKDFGLKEGDSVRITGAYVRAWKSIPQLNLGERCEVSRIDSDFQPVGSGGSLRTVSEIMRAGGGVDLDVEGLVVDVRAGSGLIKRCPQCRRSILNGVCVAHGPVEGVSDLRLKAVIDDGTGAIGAVIGRADTEKLSGMTLDEAASLSARLGEGAVSARLASAVLMKRVRASGNVTVDDFGPSINVNGIKVIEVDVPAEAEALLKDVEANLS